jgi:hypothetical protein
VQQQVILLQLVVEAVVITLQQVLQVLQVVLAVAVVLMFLELQLYRVGLVSQDKVILEVLQLAHTQVLEVVVQELLD